MRSTGRFTHNAWRLRAVLLGLAALLGLLIVQVSTSLAEDPRYGQYEYDNWAEPAFCGEACHSSFYQQWRVSMMAQSFTHHWDEIEYFKLALPHAERDEKVAEVKAGCNGCHAPMAYLTGDIPPPRPEAGTRANDGVHCDFCHTITGMTGDTAYNFNYISEPGEVKYGPRTTEAAGHEVAQSDFLASTEFCGTRHNEKSPYGAWVKATQLEWQDGPYADEGIRCHDCHMTYMEMATADGSEPYPDARMHLFHGAHDNTKVGGTVEIRLYSEVDQASRGDEVVFTTYLFNQKAGHKFPTGSVEDRIVWLHVEATDADGNVFHLPVDPKGFEGEEFTIAADVLAYQDMGVPMDIPDFEGVQRDGIPVGNRIFRMPYLDPQGRMTIQQWNTASFGVDYRFGPRETKVETFTFDIPEEAAPGPMTITATMNFQKLVAPVAEFLEVPAEEAEIVLVNEQSTTIDIQP